MNFKNGKNLLLLCLSCTLFHFNSNSQTSVQTGKKKVLKVSIDTDSGDIKGSVYNVTDTTVTISRDFLPYENIAINEGRYKTFNYYNINSVTRVRKGSVWTGLITGAATGALIGLISYSKPPPGGIHMLDDPAIPATIFGLLGALGGTLVG